MYIYVCVYVYVDSYADHGGSDHGEPGDNSQDANDLFIPFHSYAARKGVRKCVDKMFVHNLL